jgi:hypothetical protein
MKPISKIVICVCATLISTNAFAEPVNGAGGDWVCTAGPRLLNYVYPYAGSDFDRALVHLSPYASPTPQGYFVKKDGDNKVTGSTADGTPFTCTKQVNKKK